MSFLIWIVVSACFVYAALQVMYAVRKYKMARKEELFLSSGREPYGSGLSHGMVLNQEQNGVVSDSRKSASWYSRLV